MEAGGGQSNRGRCYFYSPALALQNFPGTGKPSATGLSLEFLESLDNFQLMNWLTGCRIEEQARTHGGRQSLSMPLDSAMCAVAAVAVTSYAMTDEEEEAFEAALPMID